MGFAWIIGRGVSCCFVHSLLLIFRDTTTASMRIEVGILHEIDIQADLGFRHCNVVVDVIAQLLGEFVQKETFSTDSRLRQLLHLSPGLGCDTFRRCSLPQDGFCVRGLHGRWWVY
jgi:hypothetical protein